MITVYSPLTWGIYDEPPPDIPECGFVGELCPPTTRGKSIPHCPTGRDVASRAVS